MALENALGGLALDATLTGGAAKVQSLDRFLGGQVLADQAGANGVLTFTFTAAVDLAWVRCDGGTVNARVDPFGGTPTASLGIIAEPGIPTPITVSVTTLKVWAPAGSSVQVYGYRY